jgi:hypothetical protein
MIVNMTMQVTLELPDGSASMDDTHGRGWVLPDGNWIKPFVTLELNDEHDLPYVDVMLMGMDVSDMVTSAEIGD